MHNVYAEAAYIELASFLCQCMSAELKLKVLQERMAGRKDTAADLKRREGEYLSLVHIQVSVVQIHAIFKDDNSTILLSSRIACCRQHRRCAQTAAWPFRRLRAATK